MQTPESRDERILELGALAFSLLCHIGAAVQFGLSVPTTAIGRSLALDFYGSLAVSAAVSASLPFVARRPARFALFAVRAALFLFQAYPLGPHVWIKLPLLIALILEACFHLPSVPGVAAAAGLLAAAATSCRPVQVWLVSLPGASGADVIGLCLAGIAVTALAVALRHTVAERSQLRSYAARLDGAVEELVKANVAFQTYATAAGEASAQEERKRLSREIHDTTGYVMTNLIMMMEAASSLAPSGDAELQGILRSAREQSRLGLNEMRRALRELRSIENREGHGSRALDHLLKTFEKATKVKIIADYGNVALDASREVAATIYRLVQEGLTNAFRHGRATEVRVRLWEDETWVHVSVRDNGKGCKDIVEGLGLAGMRERLDALHGSLSAHSTAGGFELSAGVPYPLPAALGDAGGKERHREES